MIRIYADAEFYINEYLLGRSPIIPLNEFDAWALQASAIIDMATFGSIADEIPIEVRMCTCELAEQQFMLNQNSDSMGIRSESVDKYSVTYSDLQQTTNITNKTQRRILVKWLGNTGLLYRGVN